MKKRFQPYVPVISRFRGSTTRVIELRNDEFSAARPFITPAAEDVGRADLIPIQLHDLDQKLAKQREVIVLSKAVTIQRDGEDPIVAVDSPTFRKNFPKVTDKVPVPEVMAEVLVETTAPTSPNQLITMSAALPETEQRGFAACNPFASIKGKTCIAEEQLRMEKETTAYLLTKVSELQTLLAEAKQVNSNNHRDFGMFTKIELRNLMASHGPAKEIVNELVARGASEQTLERSRGLSKEDMYKLYCEHPNVGEEFERYMKEALVKYKMLCKDSYMQALSEVEKDCKAWLGFQNEVLLKAAGAGGVVDFDGWIENVGPSPAARAMQKPVIWATPHIPRDPAKAVENVKDAAEKARASLEGVKCKQELDMGDESVHKRIMRNMGNSYG